MRREKFYTEEQKEVYSFIKILVGLIVILAILYLLTVFVFNKEEPIKRTNKKGSIEYSQVVVGTIFKTLDSEYYVLAFDSEDVTNSYILNKATNYKSKNNALPLYTLDLSSEFNKNYVGKESNYEESSVDNLVFKGTTLIKIKDKKIVKFIENVEEIDKELN